MAPGCLFFVCGLTGKKSQGGRWWEMVADGGKWSGGWVVGLVGEKCPSGWWAGGVDVGGLWLMLGNGPRVPVFCLWLDRQKIPRWQMVGDGGRWWEMVRRLVFVVVQAKFPKGADGGRWGLTVGDGG